MKSVQLRPVPLSYEKCNQTVTVYHKEGEIYTRQVIDHAFFDHKETQNVDKTGGGSVNTFLLVIPCDEQLVFKGDKVLLGEGPKIATREEWAGFIPAKVAGLSVVRYVDCKYWQGKMCHLEAGG